MLVVSGALRLPVSLRRLTTHEEDSRADRSRRFLDADLRRRHHERRHQEGRRQEKGQEEEVDAKVLLYGTYLHECLFLLDFGILDTSFISDPKDRAMIDKLLTHPIIQNLSKQVKQGTAKVLKEYAYLDQKTGLTSIIDLLILEGNQATIIDYKTNHIDDEAYAKQLKTYGHYLKGQGLTIKALILLSIQQSQLKQIAFENK